MAMVVDKEKVQNIRTELEKEGYYDDSRKMLCLSDQAFLLPAWLNSSFTEKIAMPITESCSSKFLSFQEMAVPLPYPFEYCFISDSIHLPSKKLHANPSVVLKTAVSKLLHESGDVTVCEMLKCIPTSWERHGDLVVLPSTSFSGGLWKSYFCSLSVGQLSNFWCMVSSSLGCKRVALGSKVCDDSYRSSEVTLVLGENGWVDHVDNGIRYIFDVTKCMFSAGNISEKLRVASFDCSGETVVDMYAGIGYFVLPYLVHAGAELVHACEWNPHAVEALQRGLKANGVEDRCIVHHGDNKKAGLKNIADRVNVGLIPSSEEGWPVACAALKQSTGGWLHIHGNVTTKLLDNSGSEPSAPFAQDYQRYSYLLSSKCLRCVLVTNWISYVAKQVCMFFEESESVAQGWLVEVRHVEHVKSYAPHISHLVLDLECRPK